MVSLDEVKEPPHSRVTEEAFIACLLMNDDIIALTKAKKDRFFDKNLGSIYDAVLSLYRQKKHIDIITIQQESGIDSNEIMNYWLSVMTTSWRREYEEILNEYYTRRLLLQAAKNIETNILEKSTDELLMDMRKFLNVVEEKDHGEDGEQLVIDTISALTDKQENVCNYGYPLLDKYLTGYKEWQLIVIGWRPWFGKTALIIELLQRVLQQWQKASVYSLEMWNKELIKRMLANWSGIGMRELDRDENLESIASKATEHVDMMKNVMFYDKVLDYMTLDKSIRRWAIINRHKIVFIDHLWLIRGSKANDNRNQRISYLTSSLKTLAKELWISIVLLSQLNRNVERRNDEPELSDLRDSGSIEQDADIVIMLHRDKNMDGHYDNTMLDMIIRKNRNWELARIKMNSDMQYMKITEFIRKDK